MGRGAHAAGLGELAGLLGICRDVGIRMAGREKRTLLVRRGLLVASEGRLGGYWCGAEWALALEEGKQPLMDGKQQDEAPGKAG